MLFDTRACAAAPRCGGGGNAIGQKAVDRTGEKISQIFGVAGDRNDPVAVSRIGNEIVDAAIGIDEAGDYAEAKFLFGKPVEHLRDGVKRIAAAGTSWQDQDVRLRSVGL